MAFRRKNIRIEGRGGEMLHHVLRNGPVVQSEALKEAMKLANNRWLGTTLKHHLKMGLVAQAPCKDNARTKILYETEKGQQYAKERWGQRLSKKALKRVDKLIKESRKTDDTVENKPTVKMVVKKKKTVKRKKRKAAKKATKKKARRKKRR